MIERGKKKCIIAQIGLVCSKRIGLLPSLLPPKQFGFFRRDNFAFHYPPEPRKKSKINA